MKKLYRSRENRVVAGILGGFGEYLEVDPILLRVIFLAVFVFSGIFPGLVFYVLAYLIMPEVPKGEQKESSEQSAE